MVNPVFIGLDISLNHWGAVSIDYDGKVLDYRCMTDKKSEWKNQKDYCQGRMIFFETKKEDKALFEEERKVFSFEALTQFLIEQKLKSTKPYCALEGYAFGSVSNSHYQIAELIGMIKNYIFLSEIPLRIHDPLCVKLFATNKGDCLKKQMVDAASTLGFQVPSVLSKKCIKKFKGVEIPELEGIGTDVADAFFLAGMVRCEYRVKIGVDTLESLFENQRRIFLRVTKEYPVNLLARDFIKKNG